MGRNRCGLAWDPVKLELGLAVSNVGVRPLTAGVPGRAWNWLAGTPTQLGLAGNIRRVRVGREIMVEGVVFLINDNEVLDGCPCLHGMVAPIKIVRVAGG